LKNYINNNNILLSFFNDENFDLLIYAIENDTSIEMINYIILYYHTLNYAVLDGVTQKYKSPLLCALINCKFKIVTLLLKYGADINYRIHGSDIGTTLYYSNNIYRENLIFLLNHGYRITPKLLSILIKHNCFILLRCIFDHYFFNKNFILTLLTITRKKISMSPQELHYLILKEKTKYSFKFDLYDKALYYDNRKVLKMLFNYDGMDFILSLNDDKLCELVNEAIENFNYEFIKVLLKNKLFNVNNLNIELFLSKKYFSYEKLKLKLGIMKFFTQKLLNHATFDFKIINFESIIYHLRQIGSISFIRIFMEQSFKHKTFDFKRVNFKNILLIINEMYYNTKLMKFIIIQSLNHDTFNLKLINFENIISILNSGKFDEADKNHILKLFIVKSINNKTFDYERINLKQLLQLNVNISILKYFIQHLFQSNKFNIKNNEKLKEIILALNKIEDFGFSEFVIDKLLNHPMFDFKESINVNSIILIASRLDNIYNFRYLIKKIFSHKSLEFTDHNLEAVLLAMSKINNNIYREMVIEQAFMPNRFSLQNSIYDFTTINISKIIHSANIYNNVSVIEWILNNIVKEEDHQKKIDFYKSILLLASKIDNMNVMKSILMKLFITNSLDDLENKNLTIIKEYDTPFYSLIINALIKLHNLSLIKYLVGHNELKDKININLKDENNEYPIITSVIASENENYTENLNIFEYLMEYGADSQVKDINGNSLLLVTIKNKNYIILHQLFQRNISFKSSIDLNNSSLLIQSIYQNNIDQVQTLVENEYSDFMKTRDKNHNNNCAFTPLILSYLLNRRTIFDFLIDKYNINELDENGYSLLHYAILKEDIDIVKQLIEQGADVNSIKNKNMTYQSAIDISLHIKNQEVFSVLIDSKTLLFNKLNEKGETLLISLYKRNNYTIDEKISFIKCVLEKDIHIDINKFDKYGKSIIAYAYEDNCLPLIKLLLDHGAIFDNNLKNSVLNNSIDENSLSLLKLLMDYNIIMNTESLLKNAIDENSFPIFKLLIDHGIITNPESILRYAIEYGEVPMVEYLAIYNINYFTKNIMKEIIYKNKFNLIKMLIPKHLQINRKNETDMLFAVECSNKKIIQYLIDCGSDVNKCYSYHQTYCIPITIAIKNDNINIVKYLINQGTTINKNNSSNNDLSVTVESNNECIIKYLKENGGDINKSEKDGYYIIKFYNEFIENFLKTKCNDHDSHDESDLDEDNIKLLEFYKNRHSPSKNNHHSTKYNKTSKMNEEKQKVIQLFKAIELEAIEKIKELVDWGIDIDEINDNGDTPLIFSIKNENLDMVKFLLDLSANPNQEDDFGKTPLIYAIESENMPIIRCLVDRGATIAQNNNKILLFAIKIGNLDLIKFLIEVGVDVNHCSNHGTTPLIFTIERGNLELVKFLITNKADPNTKDYYGHTPLIKAIVVGNLDMVNYLINHGANVQEKGESNTIPLIVAIKNRNIPIVKSLVDHGANINESDRYGISPLIYSIKNMDVDTVKYLVDAGADVERCDKAGETPLIHAIINGNLAIIKYLIEGGVDVNRRNSSGHKPLVIAFKNSNHQIVQCLIDSGANDDDPTEEGKRTSEKTSINNSLSILFAEGNPQSEQKDSNKNNKFALSMSLFHAIGKGDIDMVEKLVASGADIHRRNLDGMTPLIYASKVGDIGIVKYMIKCGSFINMMDRYGYTALIYAIKNNDLDIVQCLIENKININSVNEYGYTPLIYAIKLRHIEIIKCLVDNGANVNELDKNVYTPLFYAIKTRNIEIIKYLIHHGADIHLHTRYSKTTLNYAIRSGEISIVKFLIEYDADIDPIGYWDFTPLTLAVYNREISIAKYLIDYGANINKKGNSYTPLILAIKGSNINLVKYIIDQGADLNEKNEYDESPLTAAMEGRNLKLIKYLMDRGANFYQFLHDFCKRHQYDDDEENINYCYRQIKQLLDEKKSSIL